MKFIKLTLSLSHFPIRINVSHIINYMTNGEGGTDIFTTEHPIEGEQHFISVTETPDQIDDMLLDNGTT